MCPSVYTTFGDFTVNVSISMVRVGRSRRPPACFSRHRSVRLTRGSGQRLFVGAIDHGTRDVKRTCRGTRVKGTGVRREEPRRTVARLAMCASETPSIRCRATRFALFSGEKCANVEREDGFKTLRFKTRAWFHLTIFGFNTTPAKLKLHVQVSVGVHLLNQLHRFRQRDLAEFRDVVVVHGDALDRPVCVVFNSLR
jgi:hypothetical protein